MNSEDYKDDKGAKAEVIKKKLKLMQMLYSQQGKM